jgi:hypothetical protein
VIQPAGVWPTDDNKIKPGLIRQNLNGVISKPQLAVTAVNEQSIISH